MTTYLLANALSTLAEATLYNDSRTTHAPELPPSHARPPLALYTCSCNVYAVMLASQKLTHSSLDQHSCFAANADLLASSACGLQGSISHLYQRGGVMPSARNRALMEKLPLTLYNTGRLLSLLL